MERKTLALLLLMLVLIVPVAAAATVLAIPAIPSIKAWAPLILPGLIEIWGGDPIDNPFHPA